MPTSTPASTPSARSTRIWPSSRARSSPWAAWSSGSSCAARSTRWSSAIRRRRRAGHRRRRPDRRAGGADRRAGDPPAGDPAADGGRPARDRDGAQDLQRSGADGRLRHQHRQARPADQRARAAQAADHHPADGGDLPAAWSRTCSTPTSSGTPTRRSTSGGAIREVDEYYNQLFRELLTYILEDPQAHRRLHRPDVRRQEPRADRRPRDQHRREGPLHGPRRPVAPAPERGAMKPLDPGRRGRAAAAEAARLQSGGGRVRRRPGLRRRGGA